MKIIRKISIIGDGGWGTTLAVYLAGRGFDVCVWGAFADYIQEIARKRENVKFLPGIKIPQSVQCTADLTMAVDFADLIVLATPSQYLSSVLEKIKLTNYKKKLYLSVVKGIEVESLKRMSVIIHEHLGNVSVGVLSGPTIASELAKGIVTTAVIASNNATVAAKLQKIFHSEVFRIYTNDDVIGVELGGSIKNVIALACGICDGLGLGTNAKSAVLTRGLAEMARLGQAMGAKKETFYGLTGLGDLVTTCVNSSSRNRSVGEAIGQGKDVHKLLKSMSMVAEGVSTSKAVYGLSRKLKVQMPICCEVYNVIYRQKKVTAALESLMKRSFKAE
ncbi:MAG: NAD(P)-dependent glycerol-3-phosphate dehydrogenase [Candidatus Omnitrophica bacterium]|nr:NAD(P)-dependent glycerol-3-phosphate dehydrogenase [Candidatus Omnitrophota bacterium]